MTPPLVLLAFLVGWLTRGQHEARARERHAVQTAEKIVRRGRVRK